MNYSSFLEPALAHWEEIFDANSTELIGSNIGFHLEDVAGSIVLFGYIPPYVSSVEKKKFREAILKIKSSVYHLSFHENWSVPWVDLGIFISSTKNDEEVFFQLLKDVEEKKGKSLVIGFTDLDLFNFLSHPLMEEAHKTIGIITNKLHLKEVKTTPSTDNYLRLLIENFSERFSNISILGVQQHFITPFESRIARAINLYPLRLSEIEQEPTRAEPLLREAYNVSIDLNSLEFNGYDVGTKKNPNGLSSREICTLARYAGASVNLKNIFIQNIQLELDEVGASLIAQILWYVSDGINFNANLPTSKSLKKYEVLLSGETITFEFDESSERWWIVVPDEIISNNGITKIPCCESDYKDATFGKIPEIMLNFFKKIT